MANNEQVRVFTKGDRLRSARFLLRNPDGTSVDLSTSADPVVGLMFRMVRSSDGSAVVAGSGGVAGSTAGLVVLTASSGECRYDWQTTAIDTPGECYAWIIRYVTTSTGHYEHFPAGRGLKFRIMGDT